MGDNPSKQHQKRQDEPKRSRTGSSTNVRYQTPTSNINVTSQVPATETVRRERLRKFENGREEQNLSNSQILPQMATDEGNPRLSRREMERMSKSTSNIPNVTEFDNVSGKSLSNVPTGRSRQESKSLSNVPPAQVQSTQNIHIQDNQVTVQAVESRNPSIGIKMTPEPNRHSKGISEKKSTSDVFNNTIVREFREAMKQFKKLSREVDEMQETNNDILRKLNTRERQTGSDQETAMLSRIEDSLEHLKCLNDRSQDKDDQVEVLSVTIETLSQTVDKLCNSLIERQNVEQDSTVQDISEDSEDMNNTDSEKSDITEDIDVYEMDIVAEEEIVTHEEIDNIETTKATRQEQNVPNVTSSSENTDIQRQSRVKGNHRDNDGPRNSDKHSRAARHSTNIENIPRIKVTRNDLGFKQKLTEQVDDNRVYCLENRIEETRSTPLQMSNIPVSQDITTDQTERQTETTEDDLFRGLGLDLDGTDRQTSELLERFATMSTKNGNEYRNLVANPSGLGREVIDERLWAEWAQEEVDRAKASPIPPTDGPKTVLCLDISASMKGAPFKQMKALAIKFVNEMENITKMGVSENIALVTVGHETRVVKHMCMDYKAIISCIEKLCPDGPTPLGGGLLMALAGALGKGGLTTFVDVTVSPRIILITDGKATPDGVLDGPDESPSPLFNWQVQLKLNAVSSDLGRRGNRVFCIPVGDANLANIKIITSESGGRIVPPEKLNYLIRMHMNFALAMQMKMQIKDTTIDEATMEIAVRTAFSSLPEDDKEAILEFAKKPEILAFNVADILKEKIHKEIRGSNLPNIGTRVKRGPDWRWQDQDSGGPGTVIGHQQEGWVYVEWDGNNGHNAYRYGHNNEYDLTVIDKPRSLGPDELIATGCAVRRGPDWKWDNQDGGDGTIGYVFKVEANGWISVRWPNGKMANYRFGAEESFDLIICDENDLKDFSSKQSTSQTTPATSSGSRKRQDRSNTDEVTGAAASGPSHRESVQKERKTRKDGTILSSASTTGTSTATRKASVTTKTTPVPTNTKSLDTTISTKSKGHPSSPSGAVSKKERNRKDEIIIIRADDKRGHSDKGNESKPLTLANKQVITPKSTEIKPDISIAFWSYQKDNKEWEPYPEGISEKIETAFSRKPTGTTVIQLNNITFRIHFPRMIQVDITTKEARPIRRTENA